MRLFSIIKFSSLTLDTEYHISQSAVLFLEDYSTFLLGKQTLKLPYGWFVPLVISTFLEFPPIINDFWMLFDHKLLYALQDSSTVW